MHKKRRYPPGELVLQLAIRFPHERQDGALHQFMENPARQLIFLSPSIHHRVVNQDVQVTRKGLV